MTEREMMNLLRKRYTSIQPRTTTERYIRAEHARIPNGWGTVLAIVDYVVVDTYGEGAVHGFEIKVSRSDFLSELKKPWKSKFGQGYCTHWWLVVPDVSIVRDDLPAGWGLMSVDKTGSLRIRKQSAVLNPAPMTPVQLGMLGRSIAKTAIREKERDAQ